MRTDRQKVEMYERLLHKLQLNFVVAMNSDNVKSLLRNIDRWSYAHRSGNGMLSDDEQQARIDAAFDKLCDIEGEQA